MRLRVHGPLPADDADAAHVVEDGTADRRFPARYTREGVATGAPGWNTPEQTRVRRRDVLDALAASVPTP